MRTSLTCVFALATLLLPLNSRAENTPATAPAATTNTIEHADVELGSALKEIVKVTDKGMEPSKISLHQLDGSIFFLNSTKESLLTLEVDFGGKKPHCASGNMKFDDKGVMRSIKPIGPKDFALMCFPDKGTYSVKAFGVAGNNKPVLGTVVVD